MGIERKLCKPATQLACCLSLIFFVIFLHADEILATGGDGKFEKKKTVKKQKNKGSFANKYWYLPHGGLKCNLLKEKV